MPDSFVYCEPPVPRMLSGLSLFGASVILVVFKRGYHEEIFTPTSADGPVLKFDFQGAETDIGGTVIDLVNLFVNLDVKLKIVGKEKAEDVADLKPTFVNNLMHSFFRDVKISLNGTPVSFKSLIEAELSHNASCKKGWLRCQGDEFQTDPGDIVVCKAFTNRQNLYNNLTTKLSYYGRLADSFLADNHKFLLRESKGVFVCIALLTNLSSYTRLRQKNLKVTFLYSFSMLHCWSTN